MLDKGQRSRAIELLRETVVDKCTLFGATTEEGAQIQQLEQLARAETVFSELKTIGDLDADFLDLVEAKAEFLSLEEIQDKRELKLEIA